MKPNSSPRWPRLAVALLAVPMLLGSPGCSTAGTGTALAYVRGDLDAMLSVPFESALHAASRAVAQLEFTKVSERKDALQAIFVSRNAAATKIEIRLERVAGDETKLRIRVGSFGDEALAIATYTAISANL